ncbi:hypothetical protein AtEden1_Chr2g0231251 [Arabidopsis thaliana]
MGIIQSGMRANSAIPSSIQSPGSDLGSEVAKWGASSVWYVRNVLLDHPNPRKVWHGFRASEVEGHKRERKERYC